MRAVRRLVAAADVARLERLRSVEAALVDLPQQRAEPLA